MIDPQDYDAAATGLPAKQVSPVVDLPSVHPVQPVTQTGILRFFQVSTVLVTILSIVLGVGWYESADEANDKLGHTREELHNLTAERERLASQLAELRNNVSARLNEQPVQMTSVEVGGEAEDGSPLAAGDPLGIPNATPKLRFVFHGLNPLYGVDSFSRELHVSILRPPDYSLVTLTNGPSDFTFKLDAQAGATEKTWAAEQKIQRGDSQQWSTGTWKVQILDRRQLVVDKSFDVY